MSVTFRCSSQNARAGVLPSFPCGPLRSALAPERPLALTQGPIAKQVGQAQFGSVAIFGLATILLAEYHGRCADFGGIFARPAGGGKLRAGQAGPISLSGNLPHPTRQLCHHICVPMS
jgi:hypothetical protein